MLEQVIEGYREDIRGKKPLHNGEDEIAPVRIAMKRALRRKWRHLAEERIADVTPRIPLGKRFWALSKEERNKIARIFEEEETRKLITSLKSRSDKDTVTVLDAAYRMKGCSSLGRLRYAVLAGIGKDARDGMCLVDLKESTKAAAPRSKKASMPASNAERVVAGARALSPFLGERMVATRFADRSVVLRELMPQDIKFALERLNRDEAVSAAKLFAGVVGKAHGRQMDRKTRDVWSKELGSDRSKTVDAPSWLWSSTVELVANHEAAYLEHCRAYAMENATST